MANEQGAQSGDAALKPITITQNVFMRGAERWSPKGVCYQPTDDIDPISDDNLETIAHLLDPNTEYGLLNLGINCLRVYQVDPTKPHDQVMRLLAQHGIYVLVGAVNSTTSVHGTDDVVPARTVNRVKAVADAFARYDNVLGFDIANELLEEKNCHHYVLVSIVKQIKQQLQAHMAVQGHRAIPIGCCTRDVPTYTLPATLAYACGNAHTRMDFIGYNCYRWGVAHGTQPNATALDQYYLLHEHFKGFPIPVMLTEFGAQCDGGREWTQIPYIFGAKPVTSTPPASTPADMASAISGCFAFRYHMRLEGFGLVQKPTPGKDPVPVTEGRGGGYRALSDAYRAVTSFSGQPNGVAALDCAALNDNPYATSGPTAGLPQTVTAILCNAISTPGEADAPKEIVFSYTFSANPSRDDWIPAVTLPQPGSEATFAFPRGTQGIGMAYQKNGSWYGGCQLRGAALLALANDQTIFGKWVAPDGNGTCELG